MVRLYLCLSVFAFHFVIAQINPVVPMNIGNKWHYSGYRQSNNWYTGPYSQICEIIADTTVNNILYYEVVRTTIQDTFDYQFNEFWLSDSGKFAMSTSLPIFELRYDTSIVADTSWGGGGLGSFHYWVNLSQETWFGQIRQIQEWGYEESSHGYTSSRATQTAKGLGPVRHSGSWTDITGNTGQSSDSLTGAFLDGLVYGKPTPPFDLTANADSHWVILQWSPNSEPNVTSYIIYEGEFRYSHTIIGSTANRLDTSLTIDSLQSGATYYFRLRAKNGQQDSSDFSVRISAVTLGPQTSIKEDGIDLPHAILLNQNYPNPFNPETEISYQLPEVSDVELSIFNVLAQKVLTLVKQRQPAGYYTTKWDGRDRFDNAVGSGIYIYQIQAGEYIKNRKMVLVR